ncbi:uncharacterized protein LOC135466031 [Liolophura sinensis]|uniref:uncharacterized protein LOC135466031 n=1 Tax=Liolophura sinensis TaxID=3198878 RepID=UPI0031590986
MGDTKWYCGLFGRHRKKQMRMPTIGENTTVLKEVEPEQVVVVSQEATEIDHTEEMVQIAEVDNVIVKETEIPMSTDEKLKLFEAHFRDLISCLTTYEARTEEYRVRLCRIRTEMDLLYHEKDKLETAIRDLIDMILSQRMNATRVLGNRLVLREADVLETRKRTESIQLDLDDKMEDLKRLKRKIDAASNTDFRLREEIKCDLRKTNSLVSTYMEEIEALHKEKIIQLKSLRQDFCNLCLPNEGHNSKEEMSKLSTAVEQLESSTYKHALRRKVSDYRLASSDLNDEVGFLIEQKAEMVEKIECIENALDSLILAPKPSDLHHPVLPESKYELPPLNKWTYPRGDELLDIVVPDPEVTSKTSLSSEQSVPMLKQDDIDKLVDLSTNLLCKNSKRGIKDFKKSSFPSLTRLLRTKLHKQDSTSKQEADLLKSESKEDSSSLLTFHCEELHEVIRESVSDIEALPSRPGSQRASLTEIPSMTDGDVVFQALDDNTKDNTSTQSSASGKEIFSVACFHWQLSLTSSPGRRKRTSKRKRALAAKQLTKPESSETKTDEV